jgi:hypothetical protein
MATRHDEIIKLILSCSSVMMMAMITESLDPLPSADQRGPVSAQQSDKMLHGN